MDIETSTAADLGRAIASGALDPAELAEQFLNNIAAHPDASRIFARLTPDRAMDEARAAQLRAAGGQRRGPLDGVPMSWKDLFDTAGIGTEAGTALMAGRVPLKDAEVLQAATMAGTICLGKTHMSEIAFSGLGYNPVTATPPCLNDPDAVPGGSSSGAAASVAMGLAPLAIGSDTGGSIRLPAAWNDLVGFKPTHGALSLTGVVPLCASFDTVGPLARSVEDASFAFEAMGGPGIDLGGGSLKGTRLAILGTIALDGVEEKPMSAFRSAAERLNKAGAKVAQIEVPELEEAFGLTAALYPPEGYAWWRPLIEENGHKMYDRIYDRVTAGKDVSAADYLAAWTRLRELRAVFAAATAGYDAVIVPTAPLLPPKVADIRDDEATYVSQNLRTLRNTRIGNLMGLCGISLPTGVPSCGIMMMAGPGRDGRLLRVAHAAEQALA